MANDQSVNRSLLHRVQDLLRRKPNSYDVVFAVGPAKKKVKAVRILLEAASPVLEQKFELWGDSVVREGSGDGIPLPDFDPEDFEIFVKLTMLDDWTANALKELKLQPGQILNLIAICRAFEMKSALSHLEDLMKAFYGEFAAFSKTDEFLRLSHAHLLAILSSDYLHLHELDVFDCACSWAKAECKNRHVEASVENLVLGDIVFEIRFPLMTPKEFTRCVKQCNILSLAEAFEIYRFISDNDTNEFDLDALQFSFKIKARSSTIQATGKAKSKSEFSTLCLKMESPIVDSPPFVCNGEENFNCVATKQKILVHGLGFLGPVDGDVSYDVTVHFTRWEGDEYFDMDKIEKCISAQKDKVFYIMLDQPIKLVEISDDDWTNNKKYYSIFYYLKGPNTKSFQRTMNKDETKTDGPNEFRFQWQSNQLAEILYSNL